MRTVVGTLTAFGQCRRDGKVEELIVSGGDAANGTKVLVEASGQAESGDARGRFRRQIADGARRREHLPQLYVQLGALGMHVDGGRHRLDRRGGVVAVFCRPDLEPSVEVLVVVTMVRRIS